MAVGLVVEVYHRRTRMQLFGIRGEPFCGLEYGESLYAEFTVEAAAKIDESLVLLVGVVPD